MSSCANTGPAFDALKAIVELIRTWKPLQPFVAASAAKIEPYYEVDYRFEKLTIESLQTNYVIRSEQDLPLGALAFVEPPDELKDRDGG